MLDTDVLSYVAKGRPPEFRARLDDIPVEHLCISVIAFAEVMAGLEAFTSDHPLRLTTEDLLVGVAVLPWDREAADRYALIQFHLNRTGQGIGPMDTLISAHALSLSIPLVTGNVRHHSRVPGLEIVDWRASPTGG